jgi:hypothetical protein
MDAVLPIGPEPAGAKLTPSRLRSFGPPPVCRGIDPRFEENLAAVFAQYLGKAIVGLCNLLAVHGRPGRLTAARYHLPVAAAGPSETPKMGKAEAMLDGLPPG